MRKVGIWRENIPNKGNNYSKSSKTETHQSGLRKSKEVSVPGAEQGKSSGR